MFRRHPRRLRPGGAGVPQVHARAQHHRGLVSGRQLAADRGTTGTDPAPQRAPAAAGDTGAAAAGAAAEVAAYRRAAFSVVRVLRMLLVGRRGDGTRSGGGSYKASGAMSAPFGQTTVPATGSRSTRRK